MLGMLSLVSEELDDPLYYVLDEVCSVMHVNAPSQNVVRFVTFTTFCALAILLYSQIALVRTKKDVYFSIWIRILHFNQKF
jgi:hypothetical protein